MEMSDVIKDDVAIDIHGKRSSYIAFAIALIMTSILLFGMLPFVTFTVVFLFGILMMLVALVHVFAAFSLFKGNFRAFWLVFAILFLIAGYLTFSTPVTMVIELSHTLAAILLCAGTVRIINAVMYRHYKYSMWLLLSGCATFVAGLAIVVLPAAPFGLLGVFLATDVLLQGISYLGLAAYMKYCVLQPNR
jgi:uncharacterized membrane protein HdeD (DUF308 family)